MKKQVLLSLALVLCHQSLYSQISIYNKYDNIESPAFQVEELDPAEIKSYNGFINDGFSASEALGYINVGRAHSNLEYAPATIINYDFSPEILDSDSIPDAIGACNVEIELINTSPKTIKEITLQFEFLNGYTQVYDIKTGDKYCVLKFSNLEGRTKSYKYKDMMNTIMNCYHILSLNDASSKKLFYNKTANSIRLHKAFIKYTDGSSSTKMAVFVDKNYNNDGSLLRDGPLRPFIEFVNNVKPHVEKQDSRNIGWHTVESGESVESISNRYGMKPEDLCKLNNIGLFTSLKKGQHIKYLK